MRPSNQSSSLGTKHWADQAMLESSRSTSASSQRSGYVGGGTGNNLLSSLSAAACQEDAGAEAVVKAVAPLIQRAMASTNKAVFQASLENMVKLRRMFGQEAIDQNIDALAMAVEKQSGLPGGEQRAGLVLRALTSLCSQDKAESLRLRFPMMHEAGGA